MLAKGQGQVLGVLAQGRVRGFQRWHHAGHACNTGYAVAAVFFVYFIDDVRDARDTGLASTEATGGRCAAPWVPTSSPCRGWWRTG